MDRKKLPKAGRSALRRGRWDEAGRVYLVTFGTVARDPVFACADTAVAAIRAARPKHLWRASEVLCWVLMPDHWHGLIQLGECDTLSGLVGRIKGAMAHAANMAGHRRGAVWAPGFHDHALRTDEDLHGIARYIVMNPVRAGLVTRVGSYPFWDAIWLDDPSSAAQGASRLKPVPTVAYRRFL